MSDRLFVQRPRGRNDDVGSHFAHGGWLFKPPQLTTEFYVMAGFFAALLLQRYGSRRAIGNRFWRIVVPC